MQATLFQTEDRAYLAAENLIKAYVLRGDTIKSLKSGMQGMSSPDGPSVSISGYIGDKRFSTDWIVVCKDMGGKLVNKTYKLIDIYKRTRINNS